MGPDLQRYMSRLPHLQVDRHRDTCQHVLTYHVNMSWHMSWHMSTDAQPSDICPTSKSIVTVPGRTFGNWATTTGLIFGKWPGEQERWAFGGTLIEKQSNTIDYWLLTIEYAICDMRYPMQRLSVCDMQLHWHALAKPRISCLCKAIPAIRCAISNEMPWLLCVCYVASCVVLPDQVPAYNTCGGSQRWFQRWLAYLCEQYFPLFINYDPSDFFAATGGFPNSRLLFWFKFLSASANAFAPLFSSFLPQRLLELFDLSLLAASLSPLFFTACSRGETSWLSVTCPSPSRTRQIRRELWVEIWVDSR